MLHLLAACVLAQPQTTFEVTFDASVRADPATGRLVVYLVREGSRVAPGTSPADGPFWDDPQPMYGIDVANLAPGQAAVIGDDATSFPVSLSRLPQGAYRAQAVLDLSRADSKWQREPGNLYSDPVDIRLGEVDGPMRIPLKLTRVVAPARPVSAPGVHVMTVRSALLSEFHGREVELRAGVVLPLDHDPARRYAAVYEVPGFGGNHEDAPGRAAAFRTVPRAYPLAEMARNVFWIVLDPESGNGHTLFADSANNGPWGRALVQELIPALESQYNLISAPSARLLRGHSSGGWSTLWLALTYPDTFGGCWSTSPDPVDFRRFQLSDIYSQPSMYTGPDGKDLPAYRTGRGPAMSVRQENLIEEVLGPDNTSGQQWDSWFAVFGQRNERGNPVALFDPATGAIDRTVAESYRAYDISEFLRRDEAKYAALFQQRIRLVVGDADNFYLNEAVALLKPMVEKISFLTLPEGGHGYIRIVPGKDHGSIMATPEIQVMPQEIIDHLRRSGHLPGAK